MRGEQNRKSLLEELARFTSAKKVRAAVVFDGAPEKNFPDNSAFKGVKVYYHKFGSNADERIKQLVESSKERKTLFVVTDDRALAAYVRRCGAKILSCNEFRGRMNVGEPPIEAKPETIKSDELGAWMRYFGVDESDDEE
jgi:predicted RNA-binding protein with PIN domain